MSPHFRSILQALLVTFLWSTSVILIVVGLEDIPPITFAGLRYTLAFICLLPLAFRNARKHDLRQLTRLDWLQLAGLGLVMYTLTQGAQFLALQYIPPATQSLMLNLTSIVVLAMGIVWLSEYPTRKQVIGLFIFLGGIMLYFYPIAFSPEQWLGLGISLFQVFSNAIAAVLGRYINRNASISALLITVISMGVGASTLLISGLVLQGMPMLNLQSWLIIVWLALVNTAFAFTLWNHTLRTLTAVESSLINSTMLIQIGILAWIFLGDSLSLQEIIGMAIAAVGIILVQLKGGSRQPIEE
ncbi:MAG: DMT family transporter [Anaerolineaceae bacterium]|nr:DMT family transporter [Anaerolineaceae bacterium]